MPHAKFKTGFKPVIFTTYACHGRTDVLKDDSIYITLRPYPKASAIRQKIQKLLQPTRQPTFDGVSHALNGDYRCSTTVDADFINNSKLGGCIVWNTRNTVLDSKLFAICATV